MQRFDGKAVLVTGAAAGIGRATALRLASEGARVACVDLDLAGARDASDAIRSAGGTASAIACDVSDAAACGEAVAGALRELGRLDALCNIAGIAMQGHATELATEQWERVIGVNLSGTFFMCRAAIPHLLETRGNIVNMASSAGLVGVAYSVGYCASKGGVVLLTRALAVEFALRGLRVNCVCPGGVDTALTRGVRFPADAEPRLLGRMMLATQLAKPEDVAAAIAYLASDDARSVNGASLAIDGGQVA
jgi:NAD(P)-dependent dehydrogenase (short-subunit alcohol dehydrogenase family)